MRAALAFALLMIAGAAEARNVLDTHFNNPAVDSAGCFARAYTGAHMAKHPQQTVRQMLLIQSAEPAPRGGVVLDVLAAINSVDVNFTLQAVCTPRGDRQNCVNTDGSQGGFTLTAVKNGGLLMELKPQGLIFGDGNGGSVWLQGDAGDDREFLIPNVDAQNCM